MHEIQRVVAHYHEWFYLITVIWTFFEGETFVILAGAVAAKGLLDPVLLGVCACLGSYLGDQCWFLLGRHFGHLLVQRYPHWRSGIDMVHRWLERWDVLFILSFRFIYGIRNFSSAAIGLSDLNVYRFMVLNFVSAAIWSVTFVSAGYWGGRGIERVLGAWAETAEIYALGLFLLAIALIWGISRWRARRAKRSADARPSKPATVKPAPAVGQPIGPTVESLGPPRRRPGS